MIKSLRDSEGYMMPNPSDFREERTYCKKHGMSYYTGIGCLSCRMRGAGPLDDQRYYFQGSSLRTKTKV